MTRKKKKDGRDVDGTGSRKDVNDISQAISSKPDKSDS